MQRVLEFFDSLLLRELFKGFALTGRYLFRRKITLLYPEQKTPASPRFSMWYSWMRVSTIASTGQASSHRPQ